MVATTAPWQDIRRFLCNPVREPTLTCRVCTEPVNGFALCWRCHRRAPIAGLADVVAPLTYAIAGRESAALLRTYKDHPLHSVRASAAAVIDSILRPALSLHERCLETAAGIPVTARVVVPSLTGRIGVHPFADVARLSGTVGEPVLTVAPDALCDRAVRTNKFVVRGRATVVGGHVLVLDDVWTTGSNAQSAALALRRAGAAAVSVVVVGRWLNPGHAPTATFLHNHPVGEYDPDRCPVTGGECP